MEISNNIKLGTPIQPSATAKDRYLKDNVLWLVFMGSYMALRWYLWTSLNQPDIDLGAGQLFLEMILLVLISAIILSFTKPHPLFQLLGSIILIFVFPLFLVPAYGMQNYIPFDPVSLIFFLPFLVGIIRTIRKYKTAST